MAALKDFRRFDVKLCSKLREAFILQAKPERSHDIDSALTFSSVSYVKEPLNISRVLKPKHSSSTNPSGLVAFVTRRVKVQLEAVERHFSVVMVTGQRDSLSGQRQDTDVPGG